MNHASNKKQMIKFKMTKTDEYHFQGNFILNGGTENRFTIILNFKA